MPYHFPSKSRFAVAVEVHGLAEVVVKIYQLQDLSAKLTGVLTVNADAQLLLGHCRRLLHFSLDEEAYFLIEWHREKVVLCGHLIEHSEYLAVCC